ncbi:murein hydrolase activator EnvC family protein [Alloiococcus sp. CFN-8]|uniref:murein hydrolase activator EnvC family protein n=1 Tax=Alloiococcus sp. CFN-8 TaxID=3416081 RepID=UPI003CE77A82
MNKKTVAMLIAGIIMAGQITVVQAAPSYIEKRQEQMKENEKRIDSLENKVNDVNNSKKAVSDEISTLKATISDRYSEIAAEQSIIIDLENKITASENKINTIQGEIVKVEAEIETVKVNIAEKEKEIQYKEELLGKRLRNLYKNNVYEKFVVVLMESEGLSDLVSRVATISRVIITDNALIGEIEKLKTQLLSEKEKLDSQAHELEINKKIVIEEQTSLKSVKAEREEKKNQLNAKIAELRVLEGEQQNKYANLSAEEKSLKAEIHEIDEINEELQADMDRFMAELNKSNQGSNNSGQPSNNSGYIRPASGRVSSEYGYRTNPVSGIYKLHAGIDIAASSGSSVYATRGGTVAYSGWMGGYGNVVIINHGNGVQSLYAHNSALKVSSGQKVSQGQLISLVGSTGNSTGPHLHFEIRVNGVLQNPRSLVNF